MRKVLIMLVLVVLVLAVGCTTEKTNTKVVEGKNAPAISGAAVVKEEAKVEPVKKVVKTEPVEKVVKTEPVKEIVKTESVKTELTNKIIKVTDSGFVPSELKVKVGETVEWQNTRVGKIDKMLIVGAQACYDVKSAILEKGKSYTHTFDKAETCTIVEAITTTQVGKVIVE